ncbi:MAG TPA: hypothetical protein VMD55_00070 [Terracidiphilus sp.]|nr:hypothetical protein [Terracidiphilus sp.]
MRMRVWAALALFSFMAGTMCGRARVQAQTPPQSAPMDETAGHARKPAPAAGPLKITYGDQSAEWTPATLAALPHTKVTVYNEHAKATQTYSGVPVIDLLTKLGVPDKPRGKQFRIYLVAVGSDGYEVVYSLGEICPDVHDATVLVADSEDGKPIADDGPLKMVATGEKRPARWVRNLVAIQVLTAD